MKVVNVIHGKGYSETYTIREWYNNTKKIIVEKMKNYNEIRKYFYKEKNLY